MNKINQYIFNLYHFILNVRDTMEYTIDREHSVEIYNNRVKVLTEELKEGHAFGNFLINNGENGEKLKARVQEFIDNFYKEGNGLITVAGDKVRVDHTQNIKILEEVGQLSDTLRDILGQYMNAARQQKEEEELIIKLVVSDERMFRVVFTMLAMREFQRAFSEFQNMMKESNGQPTPQSNFIVQNELAKLSKIMRDSRAHCHITDNPTLDLLDLAIQDIEMTEGRRDRRDNKSFKEIFDELNAKISEAVAKVEADWKGHYDTAVKEFLEEQRKAAA